MDRWRRSRLSYGRTAGDQSRCLPQARDGLRDGASSVVGRVLGRDVVVCPRVGVLSGHLARDLDDVNVDFVKQLGVLSELLSIDMTDDVQ